MQNDFKALKVGDKVIVCSKILGTYREFIGVVTRKTPKGVLSVLYEGVSSRFNPNYIQSFTPSYGNVWLEEYSEERAKVIEDRKQRKIMIKFLVNIEWEKYTNDELDNILKYISKLKSS